MAKFASDYQLLKDIYSTVDRLETKLDARMLTVEKRVDLTESKIDAIAGKIGVVVALVTLFVTGLVTLIFDFIKKKLSG